MTGVTRQLIGVAALLTAAVLMAASGWGQAEKGGAKHERRFEAFGEANLEINGVVDVTAALFSDPSDHTLLILSRQLRNAFALGVEDTAIYRLPKAAIRLEGEGVTALAPENAPVSRVGSYAFIDSAATLSAEGMTLRIVPKPPGAGEIAAPALLDYCPEYRYRRDRYLPSEGAIHDLSSYGELTEVVVLFSVSSPPCGVWVPRLMKTFQAAGNPVFNIRYLLVDSPEHPFVRRYGVNLLPTIILIHGDEELVRLKREPRTTLEEEIVAILKGED